MARLSRRSFLIGSGTAATAAVLAGCTDDLGPVQAGPTGSAVPEPADFDPGEWVSVRDQFPLNRDTAHFSAFVLASMPRQVGEAVDRHRRGLDEDTAGYLGAQEVALDQGVLDAAAEYLGGQAEDIALTDSTTMGLALVYGGLRLRPGQQVLTTEHDFFSTHESLRVAAARSGATVSRVSLYDDPATASADEMVGRLMAGVTPATRVLAVTWVHSGTGVKLPIAQIAAALADQNAGRAEADRALLCVDGVHAVGVEDATVDDLGCDVLIAGTHKWLFGPRGTGVVWANRAAWTGIDPLIPSFDSTSFLSWLDGVPPPLTLGGLTRTPGGFHTFEYRWALSEAFRFQLAIGKAAVAERTHSQATQLKEGLAGLDGLRVVTPSSPELSAGIVCVAFDSLDPFEAVVDLQQAGYTAGLTPYRTGFLRFGPSIVTTPEEVDGLIGAVAALP